MKKHSPFPWKLYQSNWCDHPGCLHDHHVELFVIDPQGSPLHRWTVNGDLEQALANAQLIAAIPELVSFCETALGLLSHCSCDNGVYAPSGQSEGDHWRRQLIEQGTELLKKLYSDSK